MNTMSPPISLDLLPIGNLATIVSLTPIDGEDDFPIRLAHLGILPGELIKTIRRAPFFADPLIIVIKGCQMALTVKEASSIMVRIQSQEN